jgi:hypothetical protein
MYEPSSERGSGYLFGWSAADGFMKENGLDLIIRAHQCVAMGYEYACQGRVLTVFSASNHCGTVHNSAAVAEICDGVAIRQFEPLPWKRRNEIVFRPFDPEVRTDGIQTCQTQFFSTPGDPWQSMPPVMPVPLTPKSRREFGGYLAAFRTAALIAEDAPAGLPQRTLQKTKIPRLQRLTMG